MAVRIPLKKAQQDFDAVLALAEHEYVVVVNKKQHYLLTKIGDRGLTDERAAELGRAAEAEYRAGKTRSFASFIRAHYPKYAKLLAANEG
ncbi:MAG: hypothetical protein WAP74_02795 [Patescibacteria group bacterium]